MRSRRTAAAAVLALLLVALAIPVWPQGAGGSTTFLVTRGASMEPEHSAGDLAVLKPATDYDVGDVAGYRSRTLGRVVLHRIVAVDGDVFTFQGDANAFRDPEQVQRADVVGRVAVALPKVGSVVLWLSSPVNGLLLAALVVLVALRLRPAPQREQGAEAADVLQHQRVVTIEDLRFPRELAITDVPDPDHLLALADRYDRPVLHDAAKSALFVVESDMLFRCRLAPPTAPALAVVRELQPRPVPEARSTGRRPDPRGRGWDYGQGPDLDDDALGAGS